MNASDILKYGDSFIQTALKDIPGNQWSTAGVCGHWSVKDIVGHLAAYENLLTEILGCFPDDPPASVVRVVENPYAWNDEEAALRQRRTRKQVLAEYNAGHTRNMELIAHIDPEQCREAGLTPWYYGPEYSLDDFLVYSYYGHKREHGAQINVFKDALNDA